MHKQMIFRAVLVVVLAVAVVGAALAQTPANPTITSNDCTLTVAFTADADADFRVVIFDDQVAVFDQTISATDGQALTFTYVFSSIGQIAPGVAIQVLRDDNQTFFVDFYTDIDESCLPILTGGGSSTPTNPCLVGVPSGAVGAAVIQDTAFYFGPDEDSQVPLDLTLEAGKTVQVIAVDGEAGFYQIVYACGRYWIPVEALISNPDEVWNNAPLDVSVVN